VDHTYVYLCVCVYLDAYLRTYIYIYYTYIHTQVRVVSGEFIDKSGIVVELSGSDCVVKLHEDGRLITVPAEDLEAVPPQKNSHVVILQVCCVYIYIHIHV
jgi:hypothetical protein